MISSERERERLMIKGSLRGKPRPTLSVPRRSVSGGGIDGGEAGAEEGEAEKGCDGEGGIAGCEGGIGTWRCAMGWGGLDGVDKFILIQLN